MAEESKIVGSEEVSVEKTDRGLFDFMGKKEEKPQEEVIVTEFEKVHVSEPEKVYKVEEEKKEEEKKEGIFDKLHRTSSSSSSSSDEEEVGEDGEKKKKKKGLKEKLKEKISGDENKPEENDTSVPVEVCEEAVSEPPVAEEKKGFLDKIKEKLPGQQKKPEEVPPPPAPVVVAEAAEKKGILDKIKEKLPGYHPKTTEEEKEKEKESH